MHLAPAVPIADRHNQPTRDGARASCTGLGSLARRDQKICPGELQQGAIAQPSIVTLALPGLLDDVSCKYLTRFELMVRVKTNATALEVPPGVLECGRQNANGDRV